MRLFLVFAATLVAATTTAAYAQERKQESKLTAAKIADVNKRISSAHDVTAKAIVDGDPRAIQKILATGFSTSGDAFSFDSRDAFINAIKSGEFKFQSIKTEVKDVKVPNATTAIVTAQRSVKGVAKGKEFTNDYQLKAVYTLEDGEWKALLWTASACKM
jgi:hypothetical protein